MSRLSDFMKDKKAFSDFLLVSDLDGTMMNRDNDVSEENKAALREFMDLGGRFAICSGRMIGSSEWLNVPVNSPSILHNGGSIYDYKKREILWTMPMPEETRDLIRELKEAFPDMAWTVYTPTEHFCLHYNEWSDWLTGIEGYDPVDNNYDLDRITDPILKFVVPASPEQIEKAREYMDRKYSQEPNPGIAYNVSLPTLFEFTGTRSDKGEALKELSRMTGVPMEDIIYMGDNMNDYHALQCAGLAVAPASALEAVREAADYISVDQDEHLMVDVLREMKKGMGC